MNPPSERSLRHACVPLECPQVQPLDLAARSLAFNAGGMIRASTTGTASQSELAVCAHDPLEPPTVFEFSLLRMMSRFPVNGST